MSTSFTNARHVIVCNNRLSTPIAYTISVLNCLHWLLLVVLVFMPFFSFARLRLKYIHVRPFRSLHTVLMPCSFFFIFSFSTSGWIISITIFSFSLTFLQDFNLLLSLFSNLYVV